jgi:predicted AlkP superfamily pyrophosphatase or phosphodiesterase
MMRRAGLILVAMALGVSLSASAQMAPKASPISAPKMTKPAPTSKPKTSAARPKLVVVIVVDQMRADYIDKFRGQWTSGLKRLVEQGAWFREAAYPYAATETCVGHATISTGALPATSGMVANAWWDRESQKMMACTADPKAKNSGYAGAAAKGGDSAWRMRVPAFADELRFQGGAATRVVTFSLKARASIMLAGHKADAATWFEGDGWVTSNVYGTLPFIEAYAKAHPVKEDFGKTWALSLQRSSYLYEEKAVGAVAPSGWELAFPHTLRGKTGGSEADDAFYGQWAASPFADTFLTKLAETAIDQLGLGKGGGTDYLGVSYSSTDYVGHAFGPQSWEVQDMYVRLDKDLGELLKHLDEKVGAENYVVALSADHGVVPTPESMAQIGADAGELHIPDVQQRIEDTLKTFGYTAPAVARIASADIYFAPGTYDKLKTEPAVLSAVMAAIRGVPGVADVYRAEELLDRPATNSPIRAAESNSYFPDRSGDLVIVPKLYWLGVSTPSGKARDYGTGHGTPYSYDQRVPVLLMGWGIQKGEYFGAVTPADIAPTLAALCGITLSTHDGRVLSEALAKKSPVAKAAAAH